MLCECQGMKCKSLHQVRIEGRPVSGCVGRPAAVFYRKLPLLQGAICTGAAHRNMYRCTGSKSLGS